MTILTLLNLAFVLFATHTGAFQKRIVGGEAASSGYVRHLAYILVRTNNGSYFPCTGTVVGRRWILSAAHCVEDEDVGGSADPRGTKVYIGSSSAFPMLSQSPLRVTRLLVHNSWKAGSFDMRHDIALLHLRDRIPDESYETVKFSSAPEAGTRVVAVGYGAMNEDGQNPKRAMQTTLIAQNFETCASREQGEVREYLRDALQVCATSVGFPKRGVTDTCYGDSGGPLFIKGPGDKARQYAITSFANASCAEAGATPWYVRVSTYAVEIRNVIASGKAKDGSFRPVVSA